MRNREACMLLQTAQMIMARAAALLEISIKGTMPVVIGRACNNSMSCFFSLFLSHRLGFYIPLEQLPRWR